MIENAGKRKQKGTEIYRNYQGEVEVRYCALQPGKRTQIWLQMMKDICEKAIEIEREAAHE
jgi:hypothetical protein